MSGNCAAPRVAAFGSDAPRDVLVVIPALNEASRIGTTVRAARDVADVRRVFVVDDGSSDDTASLARAAGADVLTHERPRGKAAALTTGLAALPAGGQAVLLLDADLGESAAAAPALLAPVLAGEAEMTIATLPEQRTSGGTQAGGRGLVVGLSRAGITRTTGFRAGQPLSGQRCLTRSAVAAALPLARGFGVETAMTIAVLRAGLRVREVPVPFFHRATGNDLAGRVHRATQLADVGAALGRDVVGGPAGVVIDRSAAAVGVGLRAVARRLPSR